MRASVWALALVVLACGRPPPAVGVLVPLSGPLAPWGEEMLAGIQMAHDELPPGDRPPLLVEDTKGSATGATAAYQALTERGATVVVGPLATDAALAAGFVARACRVPFVTPSATGHEVTRDNAYALRFCYADPQAARAMATYARQDLGLRSVAIAVDLSNRYSLGLGEAFAREFQLVGLGRIAAELTYYPTDEDLADTLGALAGLDVQGVFLPGYHEDVMTLVHGAGPALLEGLTLIGSDGWEGEGLAAALAGRTAGAYYTSHFSADEDRPAVRRFVDAYTALHDGPPGDFAAAGYDTARAVFSVFDPGKSGDGMQRLLLDIRLQAGVTGAVFMDTGGNPRAKSIVLEQLHDPRRPRFVRRLND